MRQFQPVGYLADVVKMDDYLHRGLSARRYFLVVYVVDLADIATQRSKVVIIDDFISFYLGGSSTTS